MQRRFYNPDMPTEGFWQAIDVAFEGAEAEKKLNLSIYVCRLLEEHSVTI